MTRNFTTCLLAALLAAFTLYAARKDGPTTRLDVTSHPAGATVLIDHQERGVTPLTLFDLAPGPHLVQFTKDGCRDTFESVSLELGVVRTVGARLEPLTGILLVTSDPPACDVAVKGVSLGSTPLLVTTLESGVHRLTVSSPGCRPGDRRDAGRPYPDQARGHPALRLRYYGLDLRSGGGRGAD